MSIYIRDGATPEWEPIPHDLSGDAADEQELGFYKRACKTIVWQLVPFKSFPAEGIFGQTRDWFSHIDAECFATVDDEDLVLIRNTFHGFPDPPEWGLVSRPSGRPDAQWVGWGYVPRLPSTWTAPLRKDAQQPPKASRTSGRQRVPGVTWWILAVVAVAVAAVIAANAGIDFKLPVLH